MTTPAAEAGALQERAVFFSAGGERLFGVATDAGTGDRDDLAVVLLPEGTTGGMRNEGAMIPRLGRALARDGRRSFRFDYHGVGESSGPVPSIRLDEPFVGDLTGALEWLEHDGATRFVLAGSCFGATTALAVAASRDDVRGVLALSCHFPGGAAGARTIADVESLVARDVPVAFIYGGDDAPHAQFERVRDSRDGSVLCAPGVSLQVFPGRVYSFADVALQEPVISAVVQWVRDVAATPSAAQREIEATLLRFLADEILPAGEATAISRTDPLLEGALDSFALVELTAFVEKTFDVLLDDDELMSEHFETAERLAALVAAKRHHAR